MFGSSPSNSSESLKDFQAPSPSREDLSFLNLVATNLTPENKEELRRLYLLDALNTYSRGFRSEADFEAEAKKWSDSLGCEDSGVILLLATPTVGIHRSKKIPIGCLVYEMSEGGEIGCSYLGVLSNGEISEAEIVSHMTSHFNELAAQSGASGNDTKLPMRPELGQDSSLNFLSLPSTGHTSIIHYDRIEELSESQMTEIFRLMMMVDLTLYHDGAQHWSQFEIDGKKTVTGDECFEPWLPYHRLEWLHTVMNEKTDSGIYVAWGPPSGEGADKARERPIGFLTHYKGENGEIWVSGLAVSPHHRRRGVASELMYLVKEKAGQEGRNIELDCVAFLEGTNSFYQGEGFKLTGDDSAKRGEDAKERKNYLNKYLWVSGR